jgi:chromate transporter
MNHGPSSLAEAAPAAASASAAPAHGVPFTEAVRVWARVAALSFGGPAAACSS